MALQKDLEIPGGVIIAAAYFMVGAIQHDRLNGTARATLVPYKDAAMRQGFKDAKAALDVEQVKSKPLAEALQASIDAEKAADTDEARFDTQAERALAENAVQQQNLMVQRAALVTRKFMPLSIGQGEVNLDADAVAFASSVDGDLTLAGVYAWMKAQSDWEGAVDV